MRSELFPNISYIPKIFLILFLIFNINILIAKLWYWALLFVKMQITK